MARRHTMLGIKGIIRAHWMDYTVQLMLAGLSEEEIREELKKYLVEQKGGGADSKKAPETHRFIINALSSWFLPSKELLPLRDSALALIQGVDPKSWLPFHWAIMSASYPFWFNVARQTGRLLNLQDRVTQAQIFSRLKEQYGDRETVSRNARHAVRSLVAWGVLADSEVKGCYENSNLIVIDDPYVAVLLVESALYTDPEGKGTLEQIKNSPAFFPFQLPVLTGDLLAARSKAIEVIRYGLDEELLKLKTDINRAP